MSIDAYIAKSKNVTIDKIDMIDMAKENLILTTVEEAVNAWMTGDKMPYMGAVTVGTY